MDGPLSLSEVINNKYNFNYQIEHREFGGASVDTLDGPSTEKTLNACKRADAILPNVVSGPKRTDSNNQPEQGLLELRKFLNLFVDMRPTIAVKGVSSLSLLKEEHIESAGLAIIRELTDGICFERPRHFSNHEALNPLTYTGEEIGRIVHVVFRSAVSRRGKLTSADKESMLASNKLWRKVTSEVSQLYPEVIVDRLLINACSMHLITNPKQSDVIVYKSLFDDIPSDETSVIPGSFGSSPSASFSGDSPRLCEPVYGSIPDIADKNVANPFGMVLSLAVCLRGDLNQSNAADELERHICSMIEHRQTTAGLGGKLNTVDIFEILSQKLNH